MADDYSCILPWIAVDRNTETNKKNISFTPCCYYDSQENYTDIDQYWNSKELRELRRSFIRGEKPKACSICWKLEDNNMTSLRMSVNKGRHSKYASRTNEIDLKEKPIQIKYTVGNQCNLACRMCLPTLSSGVQKVWTAIKRDSSIKIDNFDYYDYILKNCGTLRYIDIIGGEPFYHKKTKSLLKSLIEKQSSKHITLYITTNATRIDLETISLLKQFEEVVLTISTDGVGKLQEYIRPGLNWKKFESNLKLLKEEGINFQITSTLNVLNILNYEELEKWCEENDYVITNPTIIEQPLEMSPHNLPLPLRHLVPERFRNIVNSKEINADSVNFVRELDRYWNTDITSILPQWKEALNDLHWNNIDYLKKMDKELEKYVRRRNIF